MSTAPSSRDLVSEEGHEPEPHQDDPLAQLRQLILGKEQIQLRHIQERLDDPDLRAEELSQLVAEAISLRTKRDQSVQAALFPVVEEALKLSVARDPSLLATALFPIIGEAVRKAVAHALRGIVESLNHTLQRSFSLESWRWRLEAWRSGKSFGEIAIMRSLEYRVEQVFLIHRETGLLLQHVSAQGSVVQDTDLVSGMLTALQDFVRDSFGGKTSDDLETMQVGEFTVWLQHGPLALLAAVVSGSPPPELRMAFEKEVEHIHQEFAPALSNFHGDAAVFEGCQKNLQACLLGHEGLVQKKQSSVWVWVFVIPTVILLSVYAFSLYKGYQWDKYVNRLSREPGIIVANTEKHWFTYSVVGLRDPMSPDPQSLLGDFGLDSSRVTARWEPYMSLDQKFAAYRRMEADKDEIERWAIRFPLNSAQMSTEQFNTLELVEDRVKKLLQNVSQTGTKVRIEISGHADRTGNPEKNQALSQRRAEQVVKALVDRGIPPDVLFAMGFGDTGTGHDTTETFPMELDRRVNFHVVLPHQGARK